MTFLPIPICRWKKSIRAPPTTDIPGVRARSAGRGRVVYFPWDIDRTFWEVLALDHCTLLRNAVDWAANEDQPVDGQRSWRAGCGGLATERSSMTVHLVNLTNPMMMKGPLRDSCPWAAEGTHPSGRRGQGPRREVPGERRESAMEADRGVGGDHHAAGGTARSGGSGFIGVDTEMERRGSHDQRVH